MEYEYDFFKYDLVMMMDIYVMQVDGIDIW